MNEFINTILDGFKQRRTRVVKPHPLIVDVLIIVALAIYYYVNHPPINIRNPESYGFLVMIGIALLIIIPGRMNKQEMRDKARIGVSGLVLLLVVGGVISWAFTLRIFHAKLYSNRVTVENVKFSNKTLKEVDFTKTPIIDRDSTMKLGDKVMGEMPELVSQFEVSNEYTQISYKGGVYRVTPLEYPGFIKYLNNREGIPAYIRVNSTTGKTELVKLKSLGLKPMKYVPSAYFGHNLNRKLQIDYPTCNFGKPSFEIDEKGYPWYICTTYSYYGVGNKKYVNGMVLFDPITGHSKKYDVGHFPKWVDRIYPESLVMQEIDDNGSLKSGYLNSVFSQKNVMLTSDGYNYLEKDGDIWIYSGITSANNDSSNLGFVLTNLRTHKTIKFSCPGANEQAAMESAEGEVKNYGYKATFPLLVNVNGNPVYLLSLKDNGGLVKKYAMVDARDYQKAATYSAASYKNLSKLMKEYLLETGEESVDQDLQDESIKVKSFTTFIVDGKSKVYIVDDKDRKFKVEVSSANENILAFLKTGDTLHITYKKSDNINIIKDILS